MRKNKLIIKTKHLSMYKTDKGFYYGQRRSINSIAILCYKKENDQYYFLVRYQPMPEIAEKNNWDDLYPCPITGSIEINEKPIQSAIRECYEEAGISLEESSLITINQSIATTQMNEKIFFYLADATGLKQEEPKTDGTIFESVSKNIWVNEERLLNILENEIHLQSLAICYFNFLQHKKNKWN